MYCMSTELNTKYDALNSELIDAGLRAYNRLDGKVDVKAEKEYYEIQSQIKELCVNMAKHDQTLAEYYRKKDLKQKLGVE